MSKAHPRDITVALASLVQKGVLETGGSHKRTYYFFPGQPPPGDALGFDGAARGETPPPPETSALGSSVQSGPSSVQSEPSSVHIGSSSVHSDPGLAQLAERMRARKRMPPPELEDGLLALCKERYLTGAELAALTGRSAETLRSHYLNRLVASGKIERSLPRKPDPSGPKLHEGVGAGARGQSWRSSGAAKNATSTLPS